MLQVSGLNKSYGSRVLLEDVTFSVNPGERVGLVGRNGEGKTTLFRMLSGEEEADDGQIAKPKNYSIGYLSQHLSFTGKTVLAEGVKSLPKNEDGWEETYKAEEILAGLGFTSEHLELDPNTLSGGFQVRLQLGKVLISSPKLLLLDEPTNYLDITSIRWLQAFLQTWDGEIVLITHDREFMDSIVTHVLGIHRRKVKKIEGATDKYYEQVVLEEEIYEQTRQREEKRREQSQRFIDRFRAQASRARAVQSRIKLLDKQEKLEKLAHISELEFAFRSAPFPGQWLVRAENLHFGYTADEQLISGLNLAVGKEDRIAVIGPNGRGKSTLLGLLAGELKPSQGEVLPNQNMSLAYFGQTNINRLHLDQTVEGEIMDAHPEHSRKLARDICGVMMFEGDDALKKVKVLSGGERSRVLLGKLLVRPANLLLLDEPTNHLDMGKIDSLLEAIDQFPGGVIMVTHSEMILRSVATRLIVFDRGKVQLFEGTYEEFLDRVGWSTEDDGQLTVLRRSQGGRGTKKKESRAARANSITERSKVLSPLKKQIEEAERQIMQLETELEQDNADLLRAVESNQSGKISALSIALHTKKERIDKLFVELDRVQREHDTKLAEFEGKS